VSAAVRRSRRPLPSLLGGYYALLIALLFLPIAVLLLFSFNDGATLTFPLKGFTAGWYGDALDTPAAMEAVRNSFQVALGSSLIATALATMVAILIARYQFRGKRLLMGVAILPLIVPYLVLGVALLLLFAALGFERSLMTIGVAHTVIALPYALLIVLARLSGVSADLEEAAMDLGATYPATLRLIVLPIAAPAIVSAWLVAFTASFDEFALALFLAGTEPTLPVYIFGQLRFASRLPMMIALAVMVTGASLTLALLADRVRKLGDVSHKT
jgi:spermidine/putrescine transport system permease protein